MFVSKIISNGIERICGNMCGVYVYVDKLQCIP